MIWLYDQHSPGGKYLNYAAFELPTTPPGNMVRNSLRNFPLSQTDLALRRRFDITERVKLDCRVEYFNAFNHPNVALNPNNLYNAGSATTAPGPAKLGLGERDPEQLLQRRPGQPERSGPELAI